MRVDYSCGQGSAEDYYYYMALMSLYKICEGKVEH
jgi:hypothetical protein